MSFPSLLVTISYYSIPAVCWGGGLIHYQCYEADALQRGSCRACVLHALMIGVKVPCVRTTGVLERHTGRGSSTALQCPCYPSSVTNIDKTCYLWYC